MTFEEYTNSSEFEAETRDTGRRQKRNRILLLIIATLELLFGITMVVFDFIPEESLQSVPYLQYVFMGIAVVALICGIPFYLYAKSSALPTVTDYFFVAKFLYIRERMQGRWKEFVHDDVLEVRIAVEGVSGNYVKKVSLFGVSGEMALDIDAWKGRAGAAEFIDAVCIGMLDYASDAALHGTAIRHIYLQTYLDGKPISATDKPHDFGGTGIFFQSKGKWTMKGKSSLKRLQKLKNKYNIS